MRQEFILKDWSAFAPGLESREQWLHWARAPHLPAGEATPALTEMPAMQRRRVERLGRMALQVAYWCQSDNNDAEPLIFASRHGDLGRTFDMLRTLAANEPLSPTHFGLSTHNAIAAQYSIARRMRGNYLSVCAGPATAEAGMVEALGLLADGAGEVLLVVYDEPMPTAYREFADEPEAAFAWAARIALAEGDGPVLSLHCEAGEPAAAGASEPHLPHGLDVLRFLLGDAAELRFAHDRQLWRWQRRV